MPRYRIESMNHRLLLEVEAEGEADALDQLARCRGYADYPSACAAGCFEPGELLVREVTKKRRGK